MRGTLATAGPALWPIIITAVSVVAAAAISAIVTAVVQTKSTMRANEQALALARQQNENAVRLARIQNEQALAAIVREHELDEGTQHRQRVEQRRADVYSAMLADLHVEMTNIERTFPMMSGPDDPGRVERVVDNETWARSGRISAFGSREVDRLLRRWQEAANGFYVWASTMHDVQQQDRNPYPEYWEPLERDRAAARAAMLAIEDQVRVELQGVEMHGVAQTDPDNDGEE